MKKIKKILSYVLSILLISACFQVDSYARGPEYTNIEINYDQHRMLRGSRNLGNNIEMSFTSDEMWNSNGKWMDQTYKNIKPVMMRWGYDAWAFDWENEVPLGPKYWGGNNSKDAEGCMGLREFIDFTNENGIIPFVMIPIESLDEFGGTTSVEKVKELTKSMAEYIKSQGVEDAYFDMGNEVWNSGGGWKAGYYGSLFKDFYEIIKSVDSNYKLVLQRAPETILWPSYNKTAVGAAKGYFDAYDDHRYSFYDWNGFFDLNHDKIITPGSNIDGKIAIMGEMNIGWTKHYSDWKTGHVYNHGGALALLTGALNLLDTDTYDYMMTWPSHWQSEKTLPGNTKHPFGLFNMDDWATDKTTSIFPGPVMAHRIVNEYVDEYRLHVICDNKKVRAFAYENEDASRMTLIVINKWDETKLNVKLPEEYKYYSSMELVANSVYDINSEWRQHSDGLREVDKLKDDRLHYEGITVYEFFKDDSVLNSEAPAVIYPQDEQEDVSTLPTLRWENTSDIKCYKVILSENSDLSNPIIETHTGGVGEYQILSNLKKGSRYYWSLQGVGTENISDSSVQSFVTAEQ